MENQKIGNFIKELRKEKNLTQKELADKLFITDRAVSKWERGLSCPDISLLDDLSNILGVSVIELLKGRRLDKDEVINNKELIESMNYANKNMKQKIEIPGCCQLHAPVSQQDVLKLQKDADILLFVESMSNRDLTARLSFSTKLTDYFSAGNCQQDGVLLCILMISE